ncbi:MAG: oligosaccharide flippase family protein [Clostridia bacterium]|nr:oligosaccharide flippase family protein [Clostridia bacterium]
MKKQSFVKGAFLLAVATGLGKIFSAVFKIPLDRFFLHEDGMAVFNSVYNTYMFFFAAATAGFPLAISRLVASSKSREEEDTILSTALIFMTVTFGSACALIMIFSEHIAGSTGIHASAFGFRIMAPALLFCAVTAAFKGFFQGKRFMFPPALSQVSDSFGRLLAGFGVAFLLLGKSVSTVSAGALTGVPFGAFLSALILGISFKKLQRHFHVVFSGKVLKTLLFLAIPITITTSLHAIFNMVDTVTVVPTLKYFNFASAQSAFGRLGRSAMLYALPVSIATAVASSALPAVAENIKNQDKNALMRDTSLSLRLAMAISLPCMAGFIAIPDGIFTLLFDSADNALTLALIAPSAVFSSVSCVIASILQGMGKTKATVVAAVCSILTKIILTPALISVWGINGSAIATSIAYFVFMAMLIISTIRLQSFDFSIKAFILKPLVCTALCFIAATVSSMYFSAPVAICIAALAYVPAVIMSHFISYDEIKQIFAG